MSIIHVDRIEKRIRDDFEKILKKDVSIKTDEALLSRGQAALTITSLTRISVKEAVDAITDDYKDNGIDAIYIDNDSRTLYLIQSKWISKGNSVPDKGGILKFLQGVEDLINVRFEKFNDRVNKKKKSIISALRDANFRIELIIVHTGTNNLSDEVEGFIKDRVNELNDSCELFYYTIINQKDLYKFILLGSEGSFIELENVNIYNWGRHLDPYESVYGEVEAETIALWWQKFGPTLLTKNIRKFKGNTNVNASIRITLTNQPEDFWYFNNGITVLCKGISKSPLHASEKSLGMFSFKEVSIVNGAQTFGTIGETYLTHSLEVRKAKVQIKFINLEKALPEYSSKITRFTNTQNRIESKDFAALDPQQERLKEELWLDGLAYSYKSGEPKPEYSKGFDLEEATIALACAHDDIHLSILANREIGSIWLDIEKPPYKSLFNDKTESYKIWNCVSIHRVVEDLITDKLNSFNDDDVQLATHGNRFLLHLVFRKIGKADINKVKLVLDTKIIKGQFNEIFEISKTSIKKKYPSAVLYTLFKNQQKTTILCNMVEKQLGLQSDLFSDIES